MKNILIEILSVLCGVFVTLVLPIGIIGGVAFLIKERYGLGSFQFYLWIAMAWWVSINYMKENKK